MVFFYNNNDHTLETFHTLQLDININKSKNKQNSTKSIHYCSFVNNKVKIIRY